MGHEPCCTANDKSVGYHWGVYADEISVNLRNRDGSNVSHILNFLNLENLSYKKKENELEMFGFESF